MAGWICNVRWAPIGALLHILLSNSVSSTVRIFVIVLILFEFPSVVGCACVQKFRFAWWSKLIPVDEAIDTKQEGKQNTVSGRGAVDRTLICAGGISLLER